MTSVFRAADVLGMDQFSNDDLALLFETADAMAVAGRAELHGRLAARQLVSAFFQSSTRTRLSFESAMLRLGGGVLGFADPKTTRAGDYEQESLADTIQMCSLYGDVVVLRHPQTGAAEEAAEVSDVPVINAGDGWGEHPTQVFADLYAIRQRFGRIDGLVVGLLGDFRVRCMHSMLLALARYDCPVITVSPPDRAVEPRYAERFERSGKPLAVVSSVDEMLPHIDVLYMGSAIQQPDFSAGHDAAVVKPRTPDEYCVSLAKLTACAKPHLAVFDALARGDELNADLDDSPFNGYWAEAAHAVTIRMALLDLMLGD